MQVILKTYVLPVCNLTNVSRINEQRRLDLDYQRSCDPTRKKECQFFHETVMLKFINFFYIDLDQSTQYIKGLWLFYYFR